MINRLFVVPEVVDGNHKSRRTKNFSEETTTTTTTTTSSRPDSSFFANFFWLDQIILWTFDQ